MDGCKDLVRAINEAWMKAALNKVQPADKEHFDAVAASVLSRAKHDTSAVKVENKRSIYTLSIPYEGDSGVECEQKIEVTLPPTHYEKFTRSYFNSPELLQEQRALLIITDATKYDYENPANELKDHFCVEQIEAAAPVRKCLFIGIKVWTHEGSDCMSYQLGKGESSKFLSESDRKELVTHLGHVGLYVIAVDPKWMDNGIHVKMTSATSGEFQGQTVALGNFKYCTDFTCIECRNKKLPFMPSSLRQ